MTRRPFEGEPLYAPSPTPPEPGSPQGEPDTEEEKRVIIIDPYSDEEDEDE